MLAIICCGCYCNLHLYLMCTFYVTIKSQRREVFECTKLNMASK